MPCMPELGAGGASARPGGCIVLAACVGHALMPGQVGMGMPTEAQGPGRPAGPDAALHAVLRAGCHYANSQFDAEEALLRAEHTALRGVRGPEATARRAVLGEQLASVSILRGALAAELREQEHQHQHQRQHQQ